MADYSKPQPNYEPIDTLFRHNLWANTRLFEQCAGLSDAQLDASIVGAFGSIRDTLHHIANSEYGYWYRIMTGHSCRRPEGLPPPTLEGLKESIRLSGEGFIAIAPKILAQDTVIMDWQGAPRTVPCTVLMTQAITHATEHRAQILATLTQFGIQTPDLDGWTYFDEREK